MPETLGIQGSAIVTVKWATRIPRAGDDR
jgi:hypothetical protein